MTLSELGAALVEGRRRLDAGEAQWLEQLGDFDRRQGWAADGHLCCVSWLVAHCGLARPTAKERLRVAAELRRRPLLRSAFATGELSYSKVRALTRIVDVDDETDAALLEAARSATAADLEHLVRHHHRLREQDRPLDAMAAYSRRGLYRRLRWDGMAASELVLPAEDDEGVVRILDAYLTRHAVDKASAGRGAVDKASAGRGDDDPLAPAGWAQRRADALVELLEAGLAHLDAGGAVDVERAEVCVVADYDTLVERAGGTAELAGGPPISGEAARRLACDAGLVRIVTRGRSEVLDVGRKTREWNAAQRRAIRFRHGGCCAFPACGRRMTQIHHTTPWDDFGLTNLEAGVPLCSGHHRLVHEGGWSVAYKGPSATTVFTAPDGRQVRAPARIEFPFAA